MPSSASKQVATILYAEGMQENCTSSVVNKMQQNQSSRARAEEKTEAINLAGDADWRQGEGGN